MVELSGSGGGKRWEIGQNFGNVKDAYMIHSTTMQIRGLQLDLFNFLDWILPMLFTAEENDGSI